MGILPEPADGVPGLHSREVLAVVQAQSPEGLVLHVPERRSHLWREDEGRVLLRTSVTILGAVLKREHKRAEMPVHPERHGLLRTD